nr:hypothetical protein CFP56_40773 [Quercus suber]
MPLGLGHLTSLEILTDFVARQEDLKASSCSWYKKKQARLSQIIQQEKTIYSESESESELESASSSSEPTETKNKLGLKIRNLFKNCNCATAQELELSD